MELELERKCSKCKIIFPLSYDFFYKDSKNKLGYQGICKACTKIKNKLHVDNHPEYVKRKNKENYDPNNNKRNYLRNRTVAMNRSKEYGRTIRGRMYNLLESARTRAKKKNIEIDIDLDFLLEVYENQNGKCKLTGVDFLFENNEDGKRIYRPHSPSLDRINFEKGYTKDNIRLVCTNVNLSLNCFGDDIFKKMCIDFVKFNNITL